MPDGSGLYARIFPEKQSSFAEKFPLPTRLHFWFPAAPDRHRKPSRGRNFPVAPITPRTLILPSPRPGETCLDCAAVSKPNGISAFTHTRLSGRFPGGYVPLVIPTDVTSRAWLKFERAPLVGTPIGRGSRCAISAPLGGGSQALLARGAGCWGRPGGNGADRPTKPRFYHLQENRATEKNFRKTVGFSAI